MEHRRRAGAESQGLLRPERTAAGHRRCAPADVVTVRHIRSLLAATLADLTAAHDALDALVTAGRRAPAGAC